MVSFVLLKENCVFSLGVCLYSSAAKILEFVMPTYVMPTLSEWIETYLYPCAVLIWKFNGQNNIHKF